MNEDVGLLADIIEHPLDNTPRLIYADWLDDRGAPGDPPRASFIRLQIAGRPQSSRREKNLLSQNGRIWVRPLKPMLSKPTWRRGFVEAASVFATAFLDAPNDVLSLAPLLSLRFREPAGHMACLARCPHLGRLSGISFSGGRLTAIDLQPLFASPFLETLRELDLSGNELPHGRLCRHLTLLPQLTTLGLGHVRHDGRLGDVLESLPSSIRVLDLEANGLGDAHLPLLTRSLSHLHQLAISHNRFTIEGLNRLLESLPELCSLAVGQQPRAVREQLTKDYPGVTFQFGQPTGFGS